MNPQIIYTQKDLNGKLANGESAGGVHSLAPSEGTKSQNRERKTVIQMHVLKRTKVKLAPATKIVSVFLICLGLLFLLWGAWIFFSGLTTNPPGAEYVIMSLGVIIVIVTIFVVLEARYAILPEERSSTQGCAGKLMSMSESFGIETSVPISHTNPQIIYNQRTQTGNQPTVSPLEACHCLDPSEGRKSQTKKKV